MTSKLETLKVYFFLPSSSSNLGASKSTFEKLSALGYKCEARLSLLYYKMNQGQHDYMRLHKDLTDVLQQKVNSRQNVKKVYCESSLRVSLRQARSDQNCEKRRFPKKSSELWKRTCPEISGSWKPTKSGTEAKISRQR